RKLNAQKTNVKISAPRATAPIYAGSGIRPTTAVSTTPSSGVVTFESMTGTATARIDRWVSGRSVIDVIGDRSSMRIGTGSVAGENPAPGARHAKAASVYEERPRAGCRAARRIVANHARRPAAKGLRSLVGGAGRASPALSSGPKPRSSVV